MFPHHSGQMSQMSPFELFWAAKYKCKHNYRYFCILFVWPPYPFNVISIKGPDIFDISHQIQNKQKIWPIIIYNQIVYGFTGYIDFFIFSDYFVQQ